MAAALTWAGGCGRTAGHGAQGVGAGHKHVAAAVVQRALVEVLHRHVPGVAEHALIMVRNEGPPLDQDHSMWESWYEMMESAGRRGATRCEAVAVLWNGLAQMWHTSAHTPRIGLAAFSASGYFERS